MSDTEYEAFEITDYDLDNEFNINRPSRKLTKNQQIYGIWSREDSDDDGKPSFGRRQKNYASPIGFVAGGVQQPENENKEEEETLISDSSDDEPRTSFNKAKVDTSGSIQEEIAGLRKKKSFRHNPVLAQRGVGTWEKHTKGIGAKLLLQMGFQPGKGLGKDLQGIQAPIEASLRKGRGAIGAYGPEKSQKIAETADSKLKKEIKEIDKVSKWRKTEGAKNKKVRYIYKSIEDVLDQQNIQPQRKREFNELTKVKVIDMTGPEQRVLSGYHAISSNQRPSDEWEFRKDKKFTNFALPELQHNLNLLVDMCEQEIISQDRELRYHEDRIVALDAEIKNVKKVTEAESSAIDSLESLIELLEKLTNRANDGSISMEEAAETFRILQKDNATEYMIYDIGTLAPSIIRPLLKTKLEDWDPLSDPEQHLDIFKEWKDVLSNPTSASVLTVNLQDPFHRLLWETWMPCIRKAVNKWQVKNPEAMVDLITIWSPLIPSWIMENILQQLIMPRLQNVADEWNPLIDTIPVHTWTHPWMPLLGTRLRISIFPVIRQKLGIALVSWHPSDTSARLLLQPWAGVFTRAEMDTFLANHIFPKLILTLAEFVINPQQQSLEPWNWVMDWKDLAPPPLMADLLIKSFFPKWLQVLTMWLNMVPNYEQVTKWYSGWKALIPESIREQDVVKDQLRTALELMSRSVGGPAPPPPPMISQPMPDHFMGMAEAVRTAAQMVDSFKDLIQRRCEERNIVFHPMPNRYREGKQVFRCGVLQMFIDRNVAFFCDPNTNMWVPIGLQSLIDKASGMM